MVFFFGFVFAGCRKIKVDTAASLVCAGLPLPLSPLLPIQPLALDDQCALSMVSKYNQIYLRKDKINWRYDQCLREIIIGVRLHCFVFIEGCVLFKLLDKLGSRKCLNEILSCSWFAWAVVLQLTQFVVNVLEDILKLLTLGYKENSKEISLRKLIL